MKSRKGFLLAEEALKLVIALIAIGVLIYFLISLYLSYSTNKNLEFAKASLVHMIAKHEEGVTEVDIYNPYGWKISSWSFGNLPNSCTNLGWENCLCICPEKWRKGEIEECDKHGYCLKSNLEVITDGIEIKGNPLKLKIEGKVLSKNEA
ncbi:hypothetical protein GOV13_00710 [Candidatus Pacearchaeota archaeon]|nr:hypothetical protein [Candidatus Pacearchaeota archaeon]